MMTEEICLKCNGSIQHHDKHELRPRFTGGVQKYLCGVCGDGADKCIQKSRDKYGIDGPAWNYVLRKFKMKHKIPLWAFRLTARHLEMISHKREALLRLMFITDIRAMNKWLNSK